MRKRTNFLLRQAYQSPTLSLHQSCSLLSVLSTHKSEGALKQDALKGLELLSRSQSGGPKEDSEDASVVPPVPETLQETGLAESTLQQLILKMLYARGDMLGRELSEALGLKFSLIEGTIDFFKQQHFIQAKKSLGMGNSTVLFALTETGRNAARECMESNQYAGLAPVPLHQYTQIVRRQRRADGWLTPDALQQAYRRMVVTPRVLAQIGPAVSSGNSFLIYGQPGNGKTFLAEALMNVDDSCVYVPHALDCQGTIVQVFDPLYHQRVDDTEEQSVFSDRAAA